MDGLIDARAWLARARTHLQHFGQTLGPIWSTRVTRGGDASFDYTLHFDRAAIASLRIVAAEAANALFQCLDHIVAAGARAGQAERHNRLVWPFKLKEVNTEGVPASWHPVLDDKLAELEKFGLKDQAWRDLIVQTFGEHRHFLRQIDAIKEVSNGGKHWELVTTEGEALAVGWHVPGEQGQHICQIPLDHFATYDSYVFRHGEQLPDVSMQIVLRFRLRLEDRHDSIEPQSALEATTRFVETALSKAEALLRP